MTGNIGQEKEVWCSDKDPDMEFGRLFHTLSSIIACQMVDESLQVFATIGLELACKVLLLGVERVTMYSLKYRVAIQANYCRERSPLNLFTGCMSGDGFERLSHDRDDADGECHYEIGTVGGDWYKGNTVRGCCYEVDAGLVKLKELIFEKEP